MATEASPPNADSKRDIWVSASVVVACMAIFAIIVAVAYLPTRPPAPDLDAAEVRAERLDELRLETARQLTEYQMVNEAEGQVRLPLDRAVELVIQKYSPDLPSAESE